jgi:excisionase family DNA binding protein
MPNRQTSWLASDEPGATSRPPRVADLRPVGLPIMDAARYLGVSRWTVQRLRARGELDGFRIGAAAMITTESLDLYVAKQRAAERVDPDGPY